MLFLFSGAALAAGGLDLIQSSADESAMEAAIRDTAELSEEAAQLDAITSDEKAAVLGSVFRRKNTVEDIAGFKEMFAKQYTKKTTYMKWESGYPYLTDVGDNGAKLVVKTDVDGWVYITSFGDNAKGGLSGEYSFMKFYESDNGAYKKKVWVQGGIETKIAVSSASWASGNTYRTYYCLRTNGNESGFGQANFTVPKFWYNIEMLQSELLYDTEDSIYYYDYFFYLSSSHKVLYESMHYWPYWDDGAYVYELYVNPSATVLIDYDFTTDYEVENYVDTRVTAPDGKQYYKIFILPGPDVA